MIDFMVISLPRSGSAWMANLLTTDTSLCLHEAFIDHTLWQLDSMKYSGKLGIAETSALFMDDAINHPCKKIIIDRSIDEINGSLTSLNLPKMPESTHDLLDSVNGYRINYKDLFDYDAVNEAFDFVLDKSLDRFRHQMLCAMNVQNQDAINYVKRMF